MLGGRKECHERSMVREVREFSRITPNMPRAIGFSYDFARSMLREAIGGSGPGVNLSLRMLWRQAFNFAKQSGLHA
jgi:hypothetical protein